MNKTDSKTIVLVILVLLFVGAAGRATSSGDSFTTLNDNGGWCWFQDERALVHNDTVFIGSVANAAGTDGDNRAGNVEVTAFALGSGKRIATTVLHSSLENDDHDAPALLRLPDGRILAVYCRHGRDKLIRYRISRRPGDTTAWQPERQIARAAAVTYSNLLLLQSENGGKGRIYNFYRGEHWNPNWVYSDDLCDTWQYGGRLIAFPGRPYLKYAGNNLDTIHFVATEHHPNNYDNSLYHAYLKDGNLYDSGGTLVASAEKDPIRPEQMTRIFAGDANNVAWPCDIHLDAKGRPYIVYSVQKNRDPNEIHYRYARWDGQTWNDRFLAFAGTALYDREQDYSGLVALDPRDPNHLYLSADAHPATGDPLISKADGARHYEIFEGKTTNGGMTWVWKPITKDSPVDNLRPIVPVTDRPETILLWLRGTYTAYTRYDLDVVGIIR